MPIASRAAFCLLAAFSAALALAGCDFYESAEFEDDYVLESLLLAGDPFRVVRLSRTAGIDETYSFSKQAVSGAEMRLELLGPQGEVAERFPLVEDPGAKGVYRPEDTAPQVLPGRTYRLRAETPSGDELSASTTVPPAAELVSASAEALPFPRTGQSQREGERLRLRITSPGAADAPVRLFLINVAVNADEENLTDFARGLLNESSGDLELDDLRIAESPILDESVYTRNDDGTITIDVPWFVFSFYGTNEIGVLVLDEVLYDFIRSQAAQQGVSTLSPGEIPNALDNVGGGTGVFGSFTAVRYQFQVLPPAER